MCVFFFFFFCNSKSLQHFRKNVSSILQGAWIGWFKFHLNNIATFLFSIKILMELQNYVCKKKYNVNIIERQHWLLELILNRNIGIWSCFLLNKSYGWLYCHWNFNIGLVLQHNTGVSVVFHRSVTDLTLVSCIFGLSPLPTDQMQVQAKQSQYFIG